MASVLLLACTREAVCDVVTDYASLFNDHVEITFTNAPPKNNPLNDFPLLVTISENSPTGFSYARVDSAGADLRFVFVEGTTSNAVPYEVDTWNTNGVSSLWVNVPRYSAKDGLKLVMYWAPDDPDALPDNSPRSVWNGYTAVWHMNGTADSTTNEIAATLGAKASAYTGKIGSALGTRNAGANGPILRVESGTPIDSITNGAYTISGWLHVNTIPGGGSAWLYSARATGSDSAYAATLSSSEGSTYLKLWPDATTNYEWTTALPKEQWTHFAIMHASADGKHRLFVNGVEIDEGSKRAVWSDAAFANGFSLGGLSGTTGTLNGDLDDVRIYPNTLRPLWITNEYAQVVSQDKIVFANFYSTGNPVYIKEQEKEPGDDPSPESSGDVSVDDYAGTAVFIPDGVGEGVVLTNFVTMIKVWEGAPAGFEPKKLPFGTEDIRFFDEQGNLLPFEIDYWDVDGESFFWVKVPKLTKSSRITMCWGLHAGKTLAENDPTEVWSDYTGVWHMTDESDATANAAVGAFGPSAVQMLGAIGKAAGTQISGQHGAIVDVEANEAIESLSNAPSFTVSGWAYLNRSDIKYGALFSRATETDPAWGANFCGGTSGDTSALKVDAGGTSMTVNMDEDIGDWFKFDFVYASDRLLFYVNGEKKGESVQQQSLLHGQTGQLSIGGFAAAAEGVLGVKTLNGFIDEFRIRVGVPSETERQIEYEQSLYDEFYTREPVSWDDTAILQNRWRIYPSADKTEWDEGEDPAVFDVGEPWYGVSVLSFMNKTTGEDIPEMPTEAGDYRAIFTCEATNQFSSLSYSIDFRIRMHRPTHDLGDENDRILLLNGDRSVEDGPVYAQAYNETAAGHGRPYWVHDVDTGYDYTSSSLYYNFCGGLRHTYYARDGVTRLWDLVDVRFGNTYNNADWVLEETGDWEEWDDGLKTNQNYLAWNPAGGCLVDDLGNLAEGWHEYAAQAVLCNSLKASINSTLYTNGIGTIYFDVVNSHTDDATNGYYKIVVEIATNAIDRSTGAEYGIPTDENIAATFKNKDTWENGDYVREVSDSYAYAAWKPLTMQIKLVNGSEMTDLEPTNELALVLTGGGSYTNFYRVYVPVDYFGSARFRIRRSAINPDYTVATDVRSLVLVDNVICSSPTDRLTVQPRGYYDETKVWRETVGYEGAFYPSYPSISDRTIYARAKVTSSSGQKVAPGFLTSVTMHYRWRYLNQQSTDWMTVDLDPLTLVSSKALSWPVISGDIEYWFEAHQSGEYYEYADYSGLGLGLPGYSEEVTTVSGRSPTYETDGRDWFTRIRDGKSTYGTIKLYVRRGSLEAAEESVEMFVARDQIWRGCMLATNAVEGGIYFRFECRNKQDDSLEDFQFNTNHWYLTDSSATLPVSGFVAVGETNNWGNIPWDGATGHIMFQLDESSRALTVVHADWQDFNGWDDAHKDYFSGASTDDVTKRGTSTARREYLFLASQWAEDYATNDLYWSERFVDPGGTYLAYDFYKPFEKETSPLTWSMGEGMWVRGAYADTSVESGMAYQMAGQGRGWIQLARDAEDMPRGIEAVKFDARVAQMVSPEDCAYYESGSMLSNYTFMSRVAFDQNGNSNFTGNASLSLVAFYRPNTSCYEARWEQLTGNIEDGSLKILGPAACGQRLALYHWRYEGRKWVSTELYAATNSAAVRSWGSQVAPSAIPSCHSITNNGLMPFYIAACPVENETLLIAAIHIPGKTKAEDNVKGCTAKALLSTLASENGWLYIVYRDKDDSTHTRLTRGTYGVLSANCEGVFVNPQLHAGIVSWESTAAKTKVLATQVYPKGSSASKASFYSPSSVRDCVNDIVSDYWVVPNGRMEKLSETVADVYNGFCAAPVSQTVDIYMASVGTTSWPDDPVASCTLENVGFGRPGVLYGITNNFWSADDASVRLRAGGKIDDVRTDVVIDNIQITQWRGQDWLGEDGEFGRPTNFVYTSGWITDGALQLSPRRTPDNYPCSLRVPLCDGLKHTKSYYRGIGLGSFSISYRNAQTNACLLVQIATNGVSQGNLRGYTLDPGTTSGYWTTITNWDFSTGLYDLDSGVLDCTDQLGLHGVVGTLRVIVDPALRDKVKDVTDPTAFGSIDIVSAFFRDEPALDKGCWWGFNIRTIGDAYDIEQRMYLPDSPLMSPPPLDRIGYSLALNNSITEDCDPTELAKDPNPFREHMPFLQTPTFSSNIVGEVSFKARKYSLQKGSQCAEVTLYGTTSANVDEVKDAQWESLNVFIVSNTTYETYRYKADASKSYRAFRFAVTGVPGVTPTPGPDPVCGDEPVRVLLDDVLVSEAVRARLAFRNVGAFRHDVSGTAEVPNVPSTYEQPICDEGWGVQAEVYAAMLGDEIDETVKPRVRLHYYKGTSPWGYSQWKDKASATSAWLSHASGTNNIYRSSAEDSPGAVIPATTSPNTVYQYMLEVVYTVVNSETGGRSIATNWLESSDWSTPSWFSPVDYNVSKGKGLAENFAAFTIIDEIAPGWAWINEANLFGKLEKTKNSDETKQFVEVAKPAEYALKNWQLKLFCYKGGSASDPSTALITTNTVTFGFGSVSSDKSQKYMKDNMTFLVVACPGAEGTTLYRSSTDPNKDETLDGTWKFSTTDSTVFKSDNTIGYYSPIGIQLVRPSGVVEHEIVVIGTNRYSYSEWLRERYAPTNLVNRLNAVGKPGCFFYAGSDDGGVDQSLGVYDSRGEAAEWWNNSMKMTPGRINENQQIDPDHPTPGGEIIMVFANLDTSFGHIVQTVGSGTNTTEGQIVSIKRGNEGGLDIVYTVDPWYELGTVSETEGKKTREPVISTIGKRQYKVNVAKYASNNVTVVTSAAIDSELRKYGIDENNRYTPAVLRWLEMGEDAYGNKWYDWDSGKVYPAKFIALSGNVVTNMSLTQMYWLDMDPTVSNMFFRAGMVRPPSEQVVLRPTYDASAPQAVTNLRLGVYMSISNGNENVETRTNGKICWPPYILRGLGLEETSWNYSATSGNSWTSVTFKATGFLNNGLNNPSLSEDWIPLRYFVFQENSFDANSETTIDIVDPFSTESLAYRYGWYEWAKTHTPKPLVFFSWNIDQRLVPVSADVLCPTNRLYDFVSP